MRVLPAVLLGSKVVSMQAGSAHCLIVTQSRSLLWDAAALEAVCAGRSHEQRERGHARAADIPLPAAHVSGEQASVCSPRKVACAATRL